MKYSRVPNTTGVPNKRVAGMFFEIFLGEKKEIQEGFFCLEGEKKEGKTS